MMQITFTGTATEIREEMLVLLGITTVEAEMKKEWQAEVAKYDAEVAADEPKRGRGRPRKTEAVDPVATEATPEAAPIETVAVEVTPEPELNPEPELTPEPTPEPTGAPCPGNPQDMMSACMALVAGDSAKKIELVKLLGGYGAKTVNSLAPENYAEFWEKVQVL